jgi:hypothetical protein
MHRKEKIIEFIKKSIEKSKLKIGCYDCPLCDIECNGDNVYKSCADIWEEFLTRNMMIAEGGQNG